jgi:hypothetical protein
VAAFSAADTALAKARAGAGVQRVVEDSHAALVAGTEHAAAKCAGVLPVPCRRARAAAPSGRSFRPSFSR